MSPRLLRAALVLGLFAPGCARCTEAPAEVETSATATRAAHPPAVEDVPTPTIEQLPLPQDFAEHAGQTVTEANYVAELDRIAAELGETTPATTAPDTTTPATATPAASTSTAVAPRRRARTP